MTDKNVKVSDLTGQFGGGKQSSSAQAMQQQQQQYSPEQLAQMEVQARQARLQQIQM